MAFFRTTTPSLPDYYLRYQALKQQRYGRKTPISEVEFVVLDTETTGFDKKKDRILTIGALLLRNKAFAIKEQFDVSVQQSVRPDAETIPIHGILPKDLPNHLPEEKALEAFLEYLGPRIIVGHHISFDLAMLNQLCQRYTGKKLFNSVLDTQQLARRAEHLRDRSLVRNEEYQLDALASRYQIPLSDRHTAIGDSYITAILFLKLLERLKQRGVRMLGQLLK